MNFVLAQKKLIAVLPLFLFILDSYAKEIFAKSTNYTDVKNAVTLATSGDIVFLPSGNSDWETKTLVVPGGISLVGNGAQNTIIKRTRSTKEYLIIFDGSNGLPNKLYNIAFEGNYNNDAVYGKGVGFLNDCKNFQISGCKFSGFANCALCIGNSNTQKGVISANTFEKNYYEAIGNFGYGIAIYGGGIWDKLSLGNENAVFIEDNYFIGNRHHVASNNAARFVFRYNKIIHTNSTKNFSMIDVHGKSSWKTGARCFEIYNNEFLTAPNLTTMARTAIGIRGGDGVIFNNNFSKDIFRTIELWNEGYVCGKYPGINQTRALYIWNNQNNDELGYTNSGVANNCELSIQKNRDYFTLKKTNTHLTFTRIRF
ncbi:hypothetical protein [Aquimarina agarivorans]|uniref:hypothetical protein n=1 Tax=Aquimarina agarivorans TaxID=980584 RepID=UPI000248E85A|nr:hypothetical protein [Aquimarina agarivorans]